MTKIEGIIEMIEDGMRDARKECMWTEEMQNTGNISLFFLSILIISHTVLLCQ